MFVLFIAHKFINAKWYKSLFKGKYSAKRITNTVIDGLLFVDMIALMVSGIILSRHVFIALQLQRGLSFARTAHLLSVYWGFVLISVHAGFHVNSLIGAIGKAVGITKPSYKRKFIFRTLVIAISVYGIYTFIKRQLGMYMLLQIQFVFFDHSEPLVFFLMDYLAIMALFTYVGHIISGLLSNNYLKMEFK